MQRACVRHLPSGLVDEIRNSKIAWSESVGIASIAQIDDTLDSGSKRRYFRFICQNSNNHTCFSLSNSELSQDQFVVFRDYILLSAKWLSVPVAKLLSPNTL